MENFKFFADFLRMWHCRERDRRHVNSGTGEVTGFTRTKTLSPELKAFYDTGSCWRTRARRCSTRSLQRPALPATTTAASSGASGTP